MSPPSLLGRPRAIPYVFGAMHAVVDLTTVSVVVGASVLHTMPLGIAFSLVLTYDLIAFGGQTFIGLMVDRFARPRLAVLLGLGLTIACVAVAPFQPVAAMLFAGLGNALFHVGAGTLTLCMSRGRSAPAGIFVAPGAIGLGLGTWLGRQGLFLPWPLLAALALCVAVTLLTRDPEQHRVEHDPDGPMPLRTPAPTAAVGFAIVALLLLSIVVRSHVGFAGAQSCPSGIATVVGLTLAAFGGKALGGIVSDRIGWAAVSVGALLISAPMIAFSHGALPIILPGMFLFQMTMPVTLTAVALVMPRRPALAFGLTCLALILGALPALTHSFRGLFRPELLFGLIALSAAVLFVSLQAMGPARPGRASLA